MNQGIVDHDAPKLQFPKLDYHVLSACCWRLVSELLRRFQASHDLDVHQFYPGASSHGIVRLWSRSSASPLEIDFGLGGGENGRISVNGRPQGSILELLQGTSSAVIVDRIATAAGLGVGSKAPTNPTVLVARVFARFLERYMLAPRSFRTTSGFLDNSQSPSMASWLEHVPELWKTARHSPEGHDQEAVRLALRYWLLHRSDDSAEPCLTREAADREPALIFDMDSAVVTPTQSPGMRRSLFQDYLEAGHSIRPVLLWVEEAMRAP